MKIVAICQIHNEDIYIEQVLNNILEFCEIVHVANHKSNDSTGKIVIRMAKDNAKIRYTEIEHPGDAHEIIRPYAGTPTWVFPVDGDEIYDPNGLLILRSKILAGELDSYRQCYGNVLHCINLDLPNSEAKGYLSPPSRTMTKLYNFNAIHDWKGPCLEKCLGGEIVFKDGYSADSNLYLHEKMAWEESYFRCLHMVFLRRSSLDALDAGTRQNIVEIYGSGYLHYFKHCIQSFLGIHKKSQYKHEKYRRGDVVTVDVSSFL